MRLGAREDAARNVTRSLRTTLPRGTAGGGWKLRRGWGTGKEALPAGAWSVLGDIVRPGREGRRVRMLRSAERPAERGGEGGGPSTGKVRAGTGAAAQRDRERRTGAWVSPVAGPSAVARGSSITARCHGDRMWSPRPQLPWRHPDLSRLPKAEGARPGFW